MPFRERLKHLIRGETGSRGDRENEGPSNAGQQKQRRRSEMSGTPPQSPPMDEGGAGQHDTVTHERPPQHQYPLRKDDFFAGRRAQEVTDDMPPRREGHILLETLRDRPPSKNPTRASDTHSRPHGRLSLPNLPVSASKTHDYAGGKETHGNMGAGTEPAPPKLSVSSADADVSGTGSRPGRRATVASVISGDTGIVEAASRGADAGTNLEVAPLGDVRSSPSPSPPSGPGNRGELAITSDGVVQDRRAMWESMATSVDDTPVQRTERPIPAPTVGAKLPDVTPGEVPPVQQSPPPSPRRTEKEEEKQEQSECEHKHLTLEAISPTGMPERPRSDKLVSHPTPRPADIAPLRRALSEDQQAKIGGGTARDVFQSVILVDDARKSTPPPLLSPPQAVVREAAAEVISPPSSSFAELRLTSATVADTDTGTVTAVTATNTEIFAVTSREITSISRESTAAIASNNTSSREGGDHRPHRKSVFISDDHDGATISSASSGNDISSHALCRGGPYESYMPEGLNAPVMGVEDEGDYYKDDPERAGAMTFRRVGGEERGGAE